MSRAVPVAKLIGRSMEQISDTLRHQDRAEMIEIIYQLATCEPHVTDRQLATLRHVGQRTIKKHARNGVLSPAHQDGETNAWTFPLSAVRRYDEQTRKRWPSPDADPMGP